MAKIKKARKPSKRDKEIKAKRTGYRFKTEGNPLLHKKDGSLNKKGEGLYYKKPSAEEIEKYKKKDNEYSSDVMQIYHERRANRKHSDDNLTKKFGKGGGVSEKSYKDQSKNTKKNLGSTFNYDTWSDYTNDFGNVSVFSIANETNSKFLGDLLEGDFERLLLEGKIIDLNSIDESEQSSIENSATEYFSATYLSDKKYKDEVSKYFITINIKDGSKYEKGGGVKQNKPQSETYSKKSDKLEKAKPVGMRYTDKLAKKLGKSPNATPTKKDTEKYLGKGVYDEKRKDKSDVSLSKKFGKGGSVEQEFLEHPLLIERHKDGTLEVNFDSDSSTGWRYSTDDIGEAVAIMNKSKYKNNPKIREITITPKQLKSSNVEDIIYWLSGGNKAWRFGSDYKYDFKKTYNDLWKKEGLKIKKTISGFTTIGDLIDFYEEEYVGDYPYFYGDAMENGYTNEDDEDFAKGGGVKQNKPQSESYSRKADKLEKAKPVGKRYTNELAEELGKSPNATPTNKDVEKYLGNGVYDEKRKDKSDVSLKNKFEEGGETEANIELSVDEMKASLGREPKYPYDFIKGKKYVKCFLRPYYKLVD